MLFNSIFKYGGYTFPLILMGPWLNILARHELFYLVMMAFGLSILTFLTFNKKHTKKIPINGLFLLLLLIIISVFYSLSYHILDIGLVVREGGFFTFTLFYSRLFMFILFWLGLYLCGFNIKKNLRFLASYYFFISFINIMWGGIVLYFELPRNWELLYHSNYADGSGRPFGLTGNAAVNGTTLVLAYLMLARNHEKRGSIFSIKLFLMLAVGVIVQKSGTGLAVFFLAGIYQFRMYSYKLFYFFCALFPVMYLLFYLMPESLLFYRISPRYIYYNISYYAKNVSIFFDLDIDIFDILFGKAVALGDGILTTDFGPLFIFNQMGLFFFLFMTLFLFKIALVSNTKADKYIISVVFFSGIHYQSLFFLSTSFLFSLYVANIITMKKSS